MKYVSEKYEQQLRDLAGLLMRPVGDAALQNTVEFAPLSLVPPLKDPEHPEMGFLPPKGIQGVGIPPRPDGPRAA